MYMCIVSNTYRIGKVRIEYVSIRLMTVSSQPYWLVGQLNVCFNHREFYWGHKIETSTSSPGMFPWQQRYDRAETAEPI